MNTLYRVISYSKTEFCPLCDSLTYNDTMHIIYQCSHNKYLRTQLLNLHYIRTGYETFIRWLRKDAKSQTIEIMTGFSLNKILSLKT